MRYAIAALLVVMSFALQGQDLIVTISGDSIQCVIGSVAPNRLLYTVKAADGATDRRDILLSSVAMYKRAGYFPVILGDVDRGSLRKSATGVERRWLLSAAAGLTRRTFPLPENLTSEFYSFANGTRDGYHARGSIHYYFNAVVAIGAEYNSFFGGKSSADILFQLADSSMVTGKIVDDARLRWLGFSILLRPTSLGKATFAASIGAGPLFYTNYYTYLNNLTITGTTIAFNAKIGMDFRLSNALFLGGEIGYFHGTIDRFEFDFGSAKVTVQLPAQAAEHLERLDVALVLRVSM